MSHTETASRQQLVASPMETSTSRQFISRQAPAVAWIAFAWIVGSFIFEVSATGAATGTYGVKRHPQQPTPEKVMDESSIEPARLPVSSQL